MAVEERWPIVAVPLHFLVTRGQSYLEVRFLTVISLSRKGGCAKLVIDGKG